MFKASSFLLDMMFSLRLLKVYQDVILYNSMVPFLYPMAVLEMQINRVDIIILYWLAGERWWLRPIIYKTVALNTRVDKHRLTNTHAHRLRRAFLTRRYWYCWTVVLCFFVYRVRAGYEQDFFFSGHTEQTASTSWVDICWIWKKGTGSESTTAPLNELHPKIFTTKLWIYSHHKLLI